MTDPRRPFAALLAVAILWSAALPEATGAEPSTAAGAAHVGLDLAALDKSVAPGDDFFRYANGTWLKTTAIPPDRSSYGTGAMLVELTTQRVADLLNEAGGNGPSADADTRRVGD